MTNSATANSLIVFGSLVGLAFILVGGIIAMVYSDGSTATVVLPILLAQIGPLIVVIMGLAKSVENGTKADTISTQVQQNPMATAQLVQNTTPATPTTPPAVVVNVPPVGGSNGP